MEKRIAVFAGSFDPFTTGHLDLVRRAASLFDELYILVAVNASKKCLFPLSFRKALVEKACEKIENVKVADADGLTTDFMKSVGAKFLLRGVRNGSDMDYEMSIHWNNQFLHPDCETVFLASAQEHLAVSSSVVRELLKCGVSGRDDGKMKLSKFVPEIIVEELIEEYRKVAGSK